MRYQKIHSHIWQDEKFIKLSERGRYLFIYLMTCPHSNTIGAFVLSKKYIEADLDWSSKQLAEPFTELLLQGFILFDETVNLIIIKNHLKHNPIENENQAKAAAKIVACLPKSIIFSTILELLSKRFQEQLRKQLAEQIPKPEEEEEEEEEEGKEEETECRVRSDQKESLHTERYAYESDFLKVTEKEHEAYKAAYPNIDLQAEYNKASTWLLANPGKRKKNLSRFLNNWLCRTQERLDFRGSSKAAFQQTGKTAAEILADIDAEKLRRKERRGINA